MITRSSRPTWAALVAKPARSEWPENPLGQAPLATAHLEHDRLEQRRRAAFAIRMRRAFGDLFKVPYPWVIGW